MNHHYDVCRPVYADETESRGVAVVGEMRKEGKEEATFLHVSRPRKQKSNLHLRLGEFQPCGGKICYLFTLR